jgi:hypothetical protein
MHVVQIKIFKIYLYIENVGKFTYLKTKEAHKSSRQHTKEIKLMVLLSISIQKNRFIQRFIHFHQTQCMKPMVKFTTPFTILKHV